MELKWFYNACIYPRLYQCNNNSEKASVKGVFVQKKFWEKTKGKVSRQKNVVKKPWKENGSRNLVRSIQYNSFYIENLLNIVTNYKNITELLFEEQYYCGSIDAFSCWGVSLPRRSNLELTSYGESHVAKMFYRIRDRRNNIICVCLIAIMLLLEMCYEIKMVFLSGCCLFLW